MIQFGESNRVDRYSEDEEDGSSWVIDFASRIRGKRGRACCHIRRRISAGSLGKRRKYVAIFRSCPEFDSAYLLCSLVGCWFCSSQRGLWGRLGKLLSLYISLAETTSIIS